MKRQNQLNIKRGLLSKLVLLVALFLGSSNAWGEELTVYENWNTNNNNIPISGRNLGNNLVKSEFIIPSIELSDIAGKQITQLTFYLSTPSSNSWDPATFQVFLKETNSSFLTTFTGTSGATIVYEGPLNGTESTMQISFTTPFNYKGGNLVVGIYCTNKGTASTNYMYFTGKQDDTLAGNTSVFYTTYENVLKFIPKTTFTYTSIDSFNLKNEYFTNTTATLSWNDNGKTEWQIAYSTNSEFTPESEGKIINVNSNQYTITELQQNTPYYFCVRAKLSSDSYSEWSSIISVTPSESMELLINDANKTNNNIPIPNSTNTGTQSQFVIPSTSLAKIRNRQITKLTFYPTSTTINWANATFNIYMSEVESYDYYPSSSVTFKDFGTKVCSSKVLSVSGKKLEIELDNPFTYSDGNIIISFEQLTDMTSSSVTSQWYGISESNRTAAYYYYSGTKYYTTAQQFSPRVAINSVSLKATLGTNGFTTFACPRPLDLTALPDGLKAYKAKVYAEEGKVRFTEIDQKVAANTGILLAGTAGETYNIPVADSGTAVEGNDFLVNSTGGTFAPESGCTYFGFKKNSNPITFATFNPSTVAIPSNKAYLKVETSKLPTEARQLVAVFDDGETTSLREIRNEELGIKNAVFFNLNGQRVAQPTKGLYIVNGKKVLVP